MVITTAILEFFVTGAMWVMVLLTALFLFARDDVIRILESDAARNAGFVPALLGIPIIYIIGVIFQAVTWKYYRRWIHQPALQKEQKSQRAERYNAVAGQMRNKGFDIPELTPDMEATKYGNNLA